MSPPKTKKRLFRDGRFSNNLFMKPGLSKFGAYILTNKTGTLERVAEIIRHLPSLSEIKLVRENEADLPIKKKQPPWPLN